MTPRAPRQIRQSRRDREGATAIEFAMIALPFFFMLFAILEIGLIFVTDSVMANAVLETGRLVRTGQADGSNMTAAQFKTRMCERMRVFVADCNTSATTVDVRELPQFRNANPPDPLSGASFSTAGLTYTTGQPGSLMLIRVWYRRPLITPMLNDTLSRMRDGKVTLVATTAFRNEPYPNDND